MKNTTDLLSELNQKIATCQNIRRQHETRWYNNFLMTMGIFNMRWEEGKGLITQKSPSYKFKSAINLIYPTVRQLISKMMRTKPGLICIPVAKTDEALAVSRMGTLLLKSFLTKYDYLFYDVIFDILVYGKSFLKVGWNPDEDEGKGNIVITHLMPMEVYVDPYATTTSDASYVITHKIRPIEEIVNIYEVNKDELTPAKTNKTVFTLFETKQMPEDGIEIFEYWEKPTANNIGRHIVFTENKILLAQENPYGFIPLVDFNYIWLQNQFYNLGLVDHLIPLQREYNKIRSDIIEHEALFMRGKWFVPIHSQVREDALTSEPGEKVYYDPRGGTPVAIQGTPPPPALWNHALMIKQEFNDIAGLHEVSRGRVPQGVRSYIALAFLQEQDEQQLFPTFQQFSRSLEKLGMMAIEIAHKFYREDRLLMILGAGNKWEIIKLKETDLQNIKDIAVKVEIGTRMPTSIIARQQMLLSLWQMKVITDPTRLLKLMEFATEEELFGIQTYDEINAQIENERMTDGQAQIVNDYDNHAIHIMIHNEFRKRPQFKTHPVEIQNLFITHIEYHQRFIQIQMEMLQQLAQQQEGQRVRQRPIPETPPSPEL